MRAVHRILSIIECFTPERRSLSLQEIAERIALPKATAFRIVHSLEEAGYMVRLENQQYCLSFRFIRIAGLVKSTLDIRLLARPLMEELTERTQETVCIYTLSGASRVCIDTTTTALQLRSVTQPGDHAPLLNGSSSKLLLAYMSPTEAAPLVPAMAKDGRRSRLAVTAELAQIRQQGYAISHGERHIGLSGLAAPITDVNEQVRHCLTLSGPTARIQTHEKQFVQLLVKTAAKISRQYGGKS
ncbi:IclR family transcriptional regulator [Xylophilus sp. GW821-FHT01B05]